MTFSASGTVPMYSASASENSPTEYWRTAEDGSTKKMLMVPPLVHDV